MARNNNHFILFSLRPWRFCGSKDLYHAAFFWPYTIVIDSCVSEEISASIKTPLLFVDIDSE